MVVPAVETALWDILYGAFTNPGSMAKLAKNLSDFVLGALGELADWLDTLDPIAVANAIRDFFGNIKGEEIKNAFVRVVSTAWTKAMELKDELFPNGMRASVADAISRWIDSVDWEQVRETIVTNFTNAWEYITTPDLFCSRKKGRGHLNEGTVPALYFSPVTS